MSLKWSLKGQTLKIYRFNIPEILSMFVSIFKMANRSLRIRPKMFNEHIATWAQFRNASSINSGSLSITFVMVKSLFSWWWIFDVDVTESWFGCAPKSIVLSYNWSNTVASRGLMSFKCFLSLVVLNSSLHFFFASGLVFLFNQTSWNEISESRKSAYRCWDVRHKHHVDWKDLLSHHGS